MENVAIKIKGVSKVYKLYEKPSDRLKESFSKKKNKYCKEHYALSDVNLNVQQGEILGIIGRNGSGKSTLLKIITGVLAQSCGEVTVNGCVSALLELGAGFNPEYTGLENIYLYGTILNKTKQEIDSELDEILEFADIGEFISQPVKTYSSGMFARLAFAVAINVKPEILIVDEILSVGDLKFQIKCLKKMKEMMESGTTVLFVAHDMNTIKKFCNTAVWLNNGKVMMYGEVNKVTDRYLDFLKLDNSEICIDKHQILKNNNSISKFELNKNIVAEIKKFTIYNFKFEEVNEFGYNEEVSIEVIYDVHDETISSPVLGVAIKRVDDEYTCGLNTLLDNIEIPWKIGRNKFYLKYPIGILAVGGRYYFDVALFDETATVEIQYISRIKEVTINFDYVGEGKYIIPHEWKGEMDV